MRGFFSILILLAVPGAILATERVPDILHYGDIELSVSTGWGHPAPLETYFYQNNFQYPFLAYSTGNYRGHIAVWTIQEDELYLSQIQIEDYVRDPKGKYEYVIESYEPNDYGVAAQTQPASEDGTVWADWFSGVLDCYVRNEDGYTSYLFQVRDGNVVDTQIVTTEDYAILRDPTAGPWSEALRAKARLLLLNENYITYYYRLSEDDEIAYDGQDSRLSTGYERLSPVFGLYNNQHLNWPYNWENTEKCGAPHSHWRIEDDRLYLTGMELYSGLSFYSIDTETLDLTTLFGNRVVDGVVDANWVSGVYLIQHGYATEEDAGWPGYTFTIFNVTGYTYVRIEQGRVTESQNVPEGVDPWDLPEDADPELIQIIEDYQLPSVLDTPPAEEEPDETPEALPSAEGS